MRLGVGAATGGLCESPYTDVVRTLENRSISPAGRTEDAVTAIPMARVLSGLNMMLPVVSEILRWLPKQVCLPLSAWHRSLLRHIRTETNHQRIVGIPALSVAGVRLLRQLHPEPGNASFSQAGSSRAVSRIWRTGMVTASGKCLKTWNADAF